MSNISSPPLFDAEELKHLALKAMRTDRDEDAIRLLKEAITQAPNNGELLYLLGMAHSNLGMADRALLEITQALALAPELINARFQLGLLHFTRREFDASEAVWMPLLAALADDDPLRVFASGLTKVGHDDLQGAIVTLEHGIGLCRNEHLNEDMRRVVLQAQRFLADPKNSHQGEPNEVADKPAQSAPHVLLSGYNQQRDRQ